MQRLSPKQMEDCRDWGRRMVENLANGITPGSLSRVWGGIELYPVEQGRGKMGEVVACSRFGLAPGDLQTKGELSWGAKSGDVDGIDVRVNGFGVDVKTTKPGGNYLIWPYGKRDAFWKFCAPWLALAVVDEAKGCGELVGFISRERFFETKEITGKGHVLPQEGTWAVHKSTLLPIEMLEGDPMRVSLAERCAGKWASILVAIGLDRSFLSGKHGPCPLCRGGKDRWRWINRNGSGDWVCNQCGHGSGMDLAIRFLKSDFRAAAERIEAVLGEAKPDKVRTAPRNDERARLAARRLWQSTIPVVGAGLAYIASRGLPAPPESAIRFMPRCQYDRDTTYPALIAKIVDAQGHGVNLQKLYLTADGSAKAPVEKPYQMMPGSLPAGSAIRLYPPHHGVLGIAEGWCTALAFWVLYGIPCWALLNAGGIKRFVLPEGVEELVIAADNDETFTGAAAAYDRANRAVVQDKINARVLIPDVRGWDWNDCLLAKGPPRGGIEVAA